MTGRDQDKATISVGKRKWVVSNDETTSNSTYTLGQIVSTDGKPETVATSES